MRRTLRGMSAAVMLTAAFLLGRLSSSGSASAATSPGHGSLIEHDSLVAKSEPGTHNGGGQTIGYSFFKSARDLPFVFRKRALHPGAGIGQHEQKEDEVYYVLSGQGELTLDGEKHVISPGTAILTRTGSTHSLKQVGAEDLVIIITYPTAPGKER